MTAAPLRRIHPERAARRGIGLIRVSFERDGTTSPEIQRFAIEEHAARHNITIVDWITAADDHKYSASRNNSKWWGVLDAAIERVESGEVQSLVFWKLSRTSRNRVKWALAADRIERAGGTIESAYEPLDVTTSAGRFGRDVIVAANVLQAEVIGETWKETLERRVRHGLVYNHKPRFGYTRDTDHPSGYAPDSITGPILRDLYLRYTAGTSARQLEIDLRERGLRHGQFAPHTVMLILDSGFAAGWCQFRGERYKGIHEPIITEAEWNAYQVVRERRRKSPRSGKSSYLLSGDILRCWCGSKMYGNTSMSHGRARRIYQCWTAKVEHTHPGGSIGCRPLDDFVLEWLSSKQTKLRDAAKRVPKRPEPVADPTAAIRARMAKLSDQLDTAGLRLIDGTLPQSSYERLRDKLSAELAALDLDLKKIDVRPPDPVPMIGDILALWDRYTLDERRAAVRFFADRIIVHPFKSDPRVVIESYLND